MILDSTTRKLQIILGADVATNQCPVVVDYVDMTASATTPGVQASLTDGDTAADILAAPGASTQRKVNSISIHNADTAEVAVTVMLDDNGTDYQIISAMSLAVGDTLTYTDVDGWSMSSRTGGGAENLRAGWVQEFTANGTWIKPGNCRFFMVDVVGGGGGGGGGQGAAAGSARHGGGGGGGGKRNRALFLAKDLPATVSVTVGAQTSSASGGSSAAGSDGSGGNTSSFGTLLYGYAGGGGARGVASGSGSCGGGGGGGTGVGVNATSSTAIAGGPAMEASQPTVLCADARGGGGANVNNVGFPSFLGGGGGGGGWTSSTGGAGASSFFSASGGGGGGGVTAATPGSASSGGAGGTNGVTSADRGDGGAAGTANNAGSYGRTVPGYCGQGGGGGGGSNSSTGGRGGDGAAPGGGGAGGGGGTSVGGAGGRGAAGVVRVWGW